MCSEAYFAVTDQRKKINLSTSDMNFKDTGLVFKLKKQKNKKHQKKKTTLLSQEQESDKFLAGFPSTGGSPFK